MKIYSKIYSFLLLCIVTNTSYSQVTGDFRTNTSSTFIGNWNNPTSWERYNGTSWDPSGTGTNNPGQAPSSTSSVWLQTGVVLTLTQDASCNDLNICTNTISGVSPSALAKINLQSFTLSVTGKLRSYYGTLGAIPGTSSTSGFSVYPFSGTSGKISIVGSTRNLTNTGEWSATISITTTGYFPLEIRLDSNQIVTMIPNIKCSSLNVVSGTLDLGTGTMSVDDGTDGQGDITINDGANISCSTSGSSTNIFQRTSLKRCGSLTIKTGGTFNVLGGTPRMDVNTIILDGTVNYAKNGSQKFLQKNNDSLSADISSYSNIIISGSGNKTISNSITASGTVQLSGGTLVTGGYLTLISNASGTARVASISGTANISGDVKVQRYVPAVNRQYRMLSPSISSFDFRDLIDNIFISGTGGATNGFDPTTNNGTTIYTYHESTTGGRGWKSASAITNSLSPAQGALVYVRGDRTLPSPDWYTQNNSAYPSTGGFPAQNEVTIDFIGPINKGTISPTITYSNTGDPTSDGWNLVGNPYPSQIDWNALTKTNLDSWYYILDPNTGSYIADNGTKYIASGQAFFVQAISNTPSISFNESVKVSSLPISYFKDDDPKIAFKLIKDSFNSDIATISFNASSSKGFVRGEDALKFTNLHINFGFYIDSIYTLQFSSVPYPSTTDTFMLSTYASSGTYTIQWSNTVSAFSTSKNIYLHDLFNNNLIDLKTNSSYPFTISSTASSYGNRFQLIINDLSLLPINWKAFQAKKVNTTDVLLLWETTNERNNSNFIIERSFDNMLFEEIGVVKAKGNSSSINTYEFIDKNIFVKDFYHNYYRIKQIDANGKSEYSRIIAVANELEKSVSIHPNPANDLIHISLNSEIQGDVLITVYNSIGKLCLSMNSNEKEMTLKLSSLNAGIYRLVLINESTGMKMTKSFLKN